MRRVRGGQYDFGKPPALWPRCGQEGDEQESHRGGRSVTGERVPARGSEVKADLALCAGCERDE
ncbi:MAG: hypothetical protein ACRDQ0_08760, partial [Pseudonocardia sp.]